MGANNLFQALLAEGVLARQHLAGRVEPLQAYRTLQQVVQHTLVHREAILRFPVHTTQAVVPPVVPTPDSSSLRSRSLYQNALPPSSNPPNCSLSLSLSFFPFLRSSSSVRFSRAAAIRRRAERNVYPAAVPAPHVTAERRNSIRFYSPVLLHLLLPFFLPFAPSTYPPFALARGKVRDRPVPRNTHARLFARSIDGLINDVSAVARRTAAARPRRASRPRHRSIARLVDSVRGRFMYL